MISLKTCQIQQAFSCELSKSTRIYSPNMVDILSCEQL